MADESKNHTLAHDNNAVIKHMEMYQSIITRMASNSAACKTWAIPLVTALLAFALQAKQPSLVWLGVLPILIFYVLDCYYLMLENQFRAGFENAAEKIATNTFEQTDLFALAPKGSAAQLWRKAFKSLSTWPVYAGLIVMTVLTFIFS